MFKYISNYLKNRKKKIQRKQYVNGYDFAAGMLLRKEKTVIELESYYCDDYLDQFDLGMMDAIKDLKFFDMMILDSNYCTPKAVVPLCANKLPYYTTNI